MKKRNIIWIAAGALVLAAYLLCLPRDLFKGSAYSTVVTDRNGELLGARIADDGQWRFPPCDTIPEKYEKALIEFEDRYFYYMPGVNPFAIARAIIGNIRAGHVTSGGSTISMQVIRMSRNRERTIWQKLIESILATRLELRYSKKEILALYASHAPYGGNVVGLEAAAWRYFGRPADQLSWGEAATLAVLPNSPSSLHPGKNRKALKEKRDRLLLRLRDRKIIDSLTCELACEENLPAAPLSLPQHAYHLTEWYWKSENGSRIRTDLDLQLQKQVENIVDKWNDDFSQRNIADLAAVIIDVHSGKILAYCGNAHPESSRPGSKVDILRSPRSTGSILKPFLYCACLQEGTILPHTLIPDIPININGFSPQNFDYRFNGAVPASQALARSLNVPSVHLLRAYGVPKFHELLKACGMTTLDKSASHYGLSLILGGAEGKLLDITRMYAEMARQYQSLEDTGFPLHDKCALWYTFEALKEVNRPDEMDWRNITSIRKVAWKTGTSYGFRDGWAVGTTPDYAIGVWAGNAQGQGVPGLTGAQTAGPVLFDLFNILGAPSSYTEEEGTPNAYADQNWFLEPAPDDYMTAEVCRLSGHLKSRDCELTDTLILPKKAIRTPVCPYHKEIDGEIVFLLPPAMEWYYKEQHPEYSIYTGKDRSQRTSPLQFIYPEPNSIIYLPRNLEGKKSEIVFNLAHRDPEARVYWHLDEEYLGETRYLHQMTLSPATGRHKLTAVDQRGNTSSVYFTISPDPASLL